MEYLLSGMRSARRAVGVECAGQYRMLHVSYVDGVLVRRIRQQAINEEIVVGLRDGLTGRAESLCDHVRDARQICGPPDIRIGQAERRACGQTRLKSDM